MTGHWLDRAACRDEDPDVFFPTSGGDKCVAAQAVCRFCPVKAECLADALDKGDVYGYRGGVSGEGRRKALVGRGRPASKEPEIRRLHAKGWSTAAICLATGVSQFVVWPTVSTPRDRGVVA